MASARKPTPLVDIRFADERLNRLVQALSQLQRENDRLTRMLAGGTPGQVLTKQGSDDFDATWVDP